MKFIRLLVGLIALFAGASAVAQDAVSLRLNWYLGGLHVPLSTLRPHPYECARMTRGRRSWLSLQRMKLSFTTPCRF